MGYAKDNLSKGERIIYTTNLHWVIFVESVVILLTGFLIIFLAYEYKAYYIDYLSYGVLLFGGFRFFMQVIRHRSSEFAVTTGRVIIKVGVIKQSSLAMPLSKVESIEIDQNILGQMLGYGTINITGTGSAESKFELITNPAKFRRKMQIATGGSSDKDKSEEMANPRRYRRRRRR